MSFEADVVDFPYFKLGTSVRESRILVFVTNSYYLIPSLSTQCFRHTIVNTNSKYKEDDFTNSNAVAYFQDVFIHFRHEAPTCHPRSFIPRLTPLHIPALSQVRRVELVTAPTQGVS